MLQIRARAVTALRMIRTILAQKAQIHFYNTMEKETLKCLHSFFIYFTIH